MLFRPAKDLNMIIALKRGLLLTGLFMATLLVTACGNDLYADCELDANSPDQLTAACAREGQQSCVIENFIQCDTRVCARFKGSSPFCSTACASDADCPNGACEEIVFQSGSRYCVSNDL